LGQELPVHNVLMWVTTETGILGLVCFLGLIISAVRRLVVLFFTHRDLLARLAMATLLAITIHLLNGLTDPTFREPSVWTMFWLTMALAFALTKLSRTGAASAAPQLAANLRESRESRLESGRIVSVGQSWPRRGVRATAGG
jgi:O-antigen ligase